MKTKTLRSIHLEPLCFWTSGITGPERESIDNKSATHRHFRGRWFFRGMFVVFFAAGILAPWPRLAGDESFRPTQNEEENSTPEGQFSSGIIPADLIDLSAHYNASLTRGWYPNPNVASIEENNLNELPRGIQTLSGVPFDIRGLIQLNGRSLQARGGNFPSQVGGIVIERTAKRIHFLHGTGWQESDGTTIGFFRIGYADGETARVPIVYGEDVRDWWFWANEPLSTDRSTVAWTGTNPVVEDQNMSLRLYHSTWENPMAHKEIASIDYVSTVSNCAPFLIAITVDNRDRAPEQSEPENGQGEVAEAGVSGIVSEIEAEPYDLESIVAMAVADNPDDAIEIADGVLEAFPHEAARITGSAIAGLRDKTHENVREIVRLAVIASPADADDIYRAASAAAPQQDAAIEEGLIAAGMEPGGPRPGQPDPAAPVSPEEFSPEELERDWPLADQYLVEGRLTGGIAALEARLDEAPDDDQARFGLGVMQFLHGVERFGNTLYRYGSGGGALAAPARQRFPMFRMAVPLNPEAEMIDVEAFRAIFQQFHDDLAVAEATLAGIVSDDVQLPLRFGRIQLNLMGTEGYERQPLWRIYSQITRMPVEAPEAQQFVIDFDRGDADWLRGYCNLLMATQQIVLAHEIDEIFERTAHLFFPYVETPHTFLLERPANLELPILDAIAMIHLISLPVAEPERMHAALAHFENVVELSRTSWEHILAEEDNRNEWIPNPSQTGVLPGVEVTSEMVDDWMLFVDELESILAGETLAPLWRTQRANIGINIRRAFTEPTRLDLVLWIQGTAATPYLEEGEVTDPHFWARLQETFAGRFMGYAIWFN